MTRIFHNGFTLITPESIFIMICIRMICVALILHLPEVVPSVSDQPVLDIPAVGHDGVTGPVAVQDHVWLRGCGAQLV